MTLSNKLKNKTVTIKDIHLTDKEVVNKLSNLGFVKGAEIEILDYIPSNKTIHIKIYNDHYVLREKECKQIEVEISK